MQKCIPSPLHEIKTPSQCQTARWALQSRKSAILKFLLSAPGQLRSQPRSHRCESITGVASRSANIPGCRCKKTFLPLGKWASNSSHFSAHLSHHFLRSKNCRSPLWGVKPMLPPPESRTEKPGWTTGRALVRWPFTLPCLQCLVTQRPNQCNLSPASVTAKQDKTKQNKDFEIRVKA